MKAALGVEQSVHGMQSATVATGCSIGSLCGAQCCNHVQAQYLQMINKLI